MRADRKRAADEAESLRQKKAKQKEETKQVFEEMMIMGVPRWLAHQREKREEKEWRASGGVGSWELEKINRKQLELEHRKKQLEELKEDMVRWRIEEETIRENEKKRRLMNKKGLEEHILYPIDYCDTG